MTSSLQHHQKRLPVGAEDMVRFSCWASKLDILETEFLWILSMLNRTFLEVILKLE